MHIGKLIRQTLEEQGKTSVWLAEQLSCSRTNVYKIYERTTIDTELLLRISAILDYNFFALYTAKLEQKETTQCPQ